MTPNYPPNPRKKSLNLKRASLLNLKRVSEKMLTFIFFTILYPHQTFELQSAHVTFFSILLYHAEVFSYVLAVLLFRYYILHQRDK